MKINIAGDLVIDKSGVIDIDDRLIKKFRDTDFNLVNLEAPVTEGNNTSIKTGPSLKNDKTEILSFLSRMNIEHLTMANNHIMDYGYEGLKDTFDFCKENNINTTGAYLIENNRYQPLFLIKDNVKVCVLNFAENEWSNDLENKYGANQVDFIDNFNLIKKYKEECDQLLIVYHGGHEFYSYPSPRIKKLFHFYIDSGADFIVCHHSHCISGFEKYNNKFIFYGLGNFLFTRDVINFPKWEEGIYLNLEINQEEIIPSFNFVHFNRNTNYFNLVEERLDFDNEIISINEVIVNDDSLEEKFNKFISKKSKLYENYIDTKGMYDRIQKKLGVKKYNSNNYKVLYNLIRCESHRDILVKKLYNDFFK